MKLLIVVDMQNDFIDGVLGTKEAQEIIPNVNEEIKRCREEGYTIVFTRDTHFEDYLDTQEGKNLPVEHCIKYTHGWQISDKIDSNIRRDYVVDKNRFGYSDWYNFIGYKRVNDLEEIELIGLCTDICVISNAMILKSEFPETIVKVNSSCCAGVTPERHQIALEAMKACQIEII